MLSGIITGPFNNVEQYRPLKVLIGCVSGNDRLGEEGAGFPFDSFNRIIEFLTSNQMSLL